MPGSMLREAEAHLDTSPSLPFPSPSGAPSAIAPVRRFLWIEFVDTVVVPCRAVLRHIVCPASSAARATAYTGSRRRDQILDIRGPETRFGS